jgi:hypothetical protein
MNEPVDLIFIDSVASHDMNFKRPCWLTLWISLTLIPVGYFGAAVTPAILRFLHISYDKLGLQDLTVIAFLFVMGIGFFGTILSAVWCLFSTIFTLLRSKKAKEILYDKS